MPINLSNVNVSIQQFQRISSGKYNAGEVTLESETTLGKINNHVHRRGANTTDLSHEEVLAVKAAFVRALDSSGVVGEELDRVRAQLGLAPEPGAEVDRTLGERSIKPLTRQEVREILDRYAGTINASVGPGTIRTADETNARVSPEARDVRAGRRNGVNASLAGSRTVAANRDVLLFERLVAGDFEGIHEDDVPRMLALVRDRLASLRETFGDDPPADDRPRVGLALPGGQTVEILARGSSAELLAQLEDAEFYLVHKPFSNPDGTVPPMSPARWNDYVRRNLDYDDTERVLNAEYQIVQAPPRPLPHAVRQLAKELVDEARAKFGEGLIPPGATIGRFIKNEILAELNRLVAEAGEARRIDLGDVRTALRPRLMRRGAAMAAARRLAETAASLGIQVRADEYGEAVLKRNPALADAIARARNPAEVAQAIAGSAQAFEKMAAIGSRIDAVLPTLRERITAAVAGKNGLPAPSISGWSFVGSLVQSCERFIEGVAAGKVPCESPDEAEAAIDAEIDRYADARAAALAKIDDFHLGEKATGALKAYVFVVNSIKPKVFDLDKFRAIATGVKSDLATLERSLRAPGLQKQAGIDAIQTFSAALTTAIANQFGNLETDEHVAAVHCILNIALDGADSPVKAALDFIGTLDDDEAAEVHVANVRNSFRMAAPEVADANRQIAMTLGTPRLPPFHAAALVRAGRDAGLTAMSEADLLALFAPDKPAGKALADAVNAAPVAVSPTMLQGLAAGVLRPFAGAIHDGVASAALAASEADFPPEARARAKSAYGTAGAEPWKADALVAAAFGACGGDAEVRALVLANLDLILVGANAELRSEASVRERVEALRANFAELRQLAADDPELFAQGRELLATFHGKALPAGLLGRLVQAAWEQPDADLKGLSARSRGQAVHKAVVRFRENVDRAMLESGAGDEAYGPDEISACRDFIASRLFSLLGRADAEGLRAALRSPTGAKLAGAYAGIGAFVGNRELSDGLRAALGGTGSALRIQMFELEDALARHLGVGPGGIPAAPDPQPRPESFGAAGLVDDAIRLARERLAAAKKEAVDTYVRGASPAADRLRAVVSDRLGPEPDGPESTLSDTFQTVVGTMINRSILRDMQKFETGQETQFDIDRNRGYRIVLAGVGEVSKNPAVARDQFAKFVTKNPAATYASLDLRTRRKAHLAMAIASQGSYNAVNFGFGVVLDPQGRSVAASFAAKQGDCVFTMEINGEGGLAVRFRGVQNPTNLLVGGEPFPCGPGSRIEAKLDLLVSAEEQERLAGLDLAAYDDGPVAQIVDVDQPEDKYKVAKFAFPQGYRIRMDVGPRLVAELA